MLLNFFGCILDDFVSPKAKIRGTATSLRIKKKKNYLWLYSLYKHRISVSQWKGKNQYFFHSYLFNLNRTIVIGSPPSVIFENLIPGK